MSAFLESHKLSTDGKTSAAETLQLVEPELPESYPPAAQDQDFVALLRTFPPEQDRGRFREKLEGCYVSTLRPVELAADPRGSRPPRG